jgi:hypothetical protein
MILRSQLSGVLSPADARQRRFASGLRRVRGFEMRVAGHGGSARLISHLVRSWGHAYRVREDKNGRGKLKSLMREKFRQFSKKKIFQML